MRLAPRETVLAVATGIIALYGVSLMLARPRIETWKSLRAEQGLVRDQIASDRELIAEEDKWQAQYDELSAKLPQFAPDKRMEIHWLTVMDGIARKHGIQIVRRQAGEEKALGDIYEIPIEVKDWEGSLHALVAFLFELQTEGGMLDVRQLYVRPKEDALLRGRFTLYCAFTRGKGG